MFTCEVHLFLKGFINSVDFSHFLGLLKNLIWDSPPWPDTDSKTIATGCVWRRLHFVCVTAAAEALTVVRWLRRLPREVGGGLITWGNVLSLDGCSVGREVCRNP